MANTNGGMIVFGIKEERGTGRALEFNTVDSSESTQRRLRSILANRVHPFIAGLDFTSLSNTDGDITVLALSIPRSPEAPHLIGQRNKIGCPYRAGAETNWMRERDLERAYSARFSRRQEERAHLERLHEEAHHLLDRSTPWIVATARTSVAPTPLTASPTRADISTILTKALHRTNELIPPTAFNRYNLLRDLENSALNPRVGLRRWVCSRSYQPSNDDRAQLVHVELHHDGSIVFAAALEGWYEPILEGQYHVPSVLVECFMADFAAIADTYAQHLGLQTPFVARAELLRTKLARPWTAIDHKRFGTTVSNTVEKLPGTRTIEFCAPVLGEVPALSTIDDLRDSARTLAEDVMHQFGLPTLSLLPPP